MTIRFPKPQAFVMIPYACFFRDTIRVDAAAIRTSLEPKIVLKMNRLPLAEQEVWTHFENH